LSPYPQSCAGGLLEFFIHFYHLKAVQAFVCLKIWQGFAPKNRIFGQLELLHDVFPYSQCIQQLRRMCRAIKRAVGLFHAEKYRKTLND
jgi:hypothetical protein